MFQGQWHDQIDDAYVYEMTCNFVEAKHLGCYSHWAVTKDESIQGVGPEVRSGN